MTEQPDNVAVFEPGGGEAPDVLFVCEHASNRFPRGWDGLGLDAAARQTHIAWDPGALPLARRLAAGLGSALIFATVSRLLYDLNRAPGVPGAIAERSETTDIPGNAGLTDAQRRARVEAFYRPWRTALDAAIRDSSARALVTVHSFTPVYAGTPRSTRVGILHDRDRRLADAVLSAGAGAEGWHRNRPYGPEDGVTHTVRIGEEAGLLPLMIEVRNDLLQTDDQIDAMAAELLPRLRTGLAAGGLVRPEAPA